MMTINVNHISDMRSYITNVRQDGKSIGFAPTMGYLHDGHLELVKKARSENDVVIVSTFVNPIQFGPTEDFEQYPRDVDRDRTLLQGASADVLFAPTVEEMYPVPMETSVQCERLGAILEGAVRPSYFRGVATVVAKLFNIVQPDRAYFGEKDYQQVLLVRKMVRDLSFPISVVGVPTVRDSDGLALSSRNSYLSTDERRAAAILYKSLLAAREHLLDGRFRVADLEQKLSEWINEEPLANIDFISIRDADTLDVIEKRIPSRILVLLFVRFGRAQLLDHIVVDLPTDG